MPFDEDAPFQGPDGAPNHKPYSKAMARALNGLIKPEGDGDPPTMFYQHDEFWKKTDTLPVAASERTRDLGFIWNGGLATSATGDRPHTISSDYQCVMGMAFLIDGGNAGDIVLNFDYQGTTVLATPLTIPAGRSAYDPVFSFDFALGTLTPSAPLDFYRPVFATCVSAVGGDANAKVQQVLVLLPLTS